MLSRSVQLAARSAAIGVITVLVLASPARAQRGGGGGGSRGGGGGRGGMMGGAAPSPMQRVREELKVTNYFEFLDDKAKQIGLEKAQKDSAKTLKKLMEEEQKPLFKEMEKMFDEAERLGMQGGGGGGGGRGDGGAGGGRGGMPEGVRDVMRRLVGIQEDFATKGHLLLTPTQKPLADSLSTVYQDQLRERQRRRSRD